MQPTAHSETPLSQTSARNQPCLPDGVDRTEDDILVRLQEAEQTTKQAINECIDSNEPTLLTDQVLETEVVELTVVMPCLNEADTLSICIEKALGAMQEHGITGEVVVADNGSTDQSREIATKLGARVVDVQEKGYGSALMGGIQAARGQFIIMGDADDS